MEVRETYYEVYIDGHLEDEGTLQECLNRVLKCRNKDCAEVYEVTVTEEKVVI